MQWDKIKTRIRRYLRDPSGNIWSDALLLRLWNIAQLNFQSKFGQNDDVQVVRVPPLFQASYQFDWEWTYTDADEGYVYPIQYYDQAYYSYCHKWEPELIAGSTTLSSDAGMFVTHPWETWMTGDPGMSPPIWIGANFYEMLAVYYNKKPVDPKTQKEVQLSDRTWRTHMGVPHTYWRDDTLENFIHLYPLPSSVDWYDIDTDDGMVLFDSDSTGSDRGVITDYEGAFSHSDLGATFDIVQLDDSLFVIFKRIPNEIKDGSDVPDFSSWLLKYIEYDVLERCYTANTDGKIDSLREYWQTRKKTAHIMLDRFKSKKLVDRDYCMKTHSYENRTQVRHGRLPAAYPYQYP